MKNSDIYSLLNKNEKWDEEKVREILSDPELIGIRKYHEDRLTALFNGEKLDQPMFISGLSTRLNHLPDDDIKEIVRNQMQDLAKIAEYSKDKEIFKSLALGTWLYGVHFVDKIFGAETMWTGQTEDKEWDTSRWWAHNIKTKVGALEMPDYKNSFAFKAYAKTIEAYKSWNVTVPYIQTQVLSSTVNVFLNIYGSDGQADLLLEPKKAKKDIGIITDLIYELHKWSIENIPKDQYSPILNGIRGMPQGYGQICGCASQLVSAEVYRNYFAPSDEKIFSLYPNGGLIHLCGSSTQHIPLWRKMMCMRAFQLNDRASEDYEQYFNELREDQIIYLEPTKTMTIEKAMKISGGKRTVFVADEIE